MLPKAQVSHHSPGRTRLRIPERRRDALYLNATGRKLAVIPGVTSTRVNATTGSILLEHDLSLPDLKVVGEERALFVVEDGSSPGPISKVLADGIGRFVTGADAKLRSLSGGELDAKLVVAGGLLGLSVLQWRRGDALPAGMMLALMAIDVIKR